MYLGGENADSYQRTLQAHLGRGMSLATILSRAMVTGFGRAMAPIGLVAFPGALRWIASSTRIPDKALNKSSGLAPAVRG